MCFSATASFTTAAILLPVATYTIGTALKTDRRYLGFATFPLFFGIQQVLEGGLWIEIAQSDAAHSHLYALGLLFFAYLVWPFLVPFSAFLIEPHRNRSLFFLALSALGLFLGLSLFAPLVFNPDWVPLRAELVSPTVLLTLCSNTVFQFTVFNIVNTALPYINAITQFFAHRHLALI